MERRVIAHVRRGNSKYIQRVCDLRFEPPTQDSKSHVLTTTLSGRYYSNSGKPFAGLRVKLLTKSSKKSYLLL